MHIFTILLTIGCAFAATVATAASINPSLISDRPSTGDLGTVVAADKSNVSDYSSAVTSAVPAIPANGGESGTAATLPVAMPADKASEDNTRAQATSASAPLSRRGLARRFNWGKWGKFGLAGVGGAAIYSMLNPKGGTDAQQQPAVGYEQTQEGVA